MARVLSLISGALLCLLIPTGADAARYTIELGVQNTIDYQLSSGDDGAVVSEGWSSWQEPAFRLERRASSLISAWDYTLTLQPFLAQYRDRFKEDLQINQTLFAKGSPARVDFIFHNARILLDRAAFGDSNNYLRYGGVLAWRYAENKITSGTLREVETSSMLLPLLHLAGSVQISPKWRWFVQSDFVIPSTRGWVYDLFSGIALRDSIWELGVRLFSGGYHPRRTGNSNLEVLYLTVAARINF